MKRLGSVIFLTIYILVFAACEYLIHFVRANIEISSATMFALRSFEWISALGAIIETIELVFGLEIRAKIKDLFELSWKKFRKD